jgi:hypothetical protein
LSMRWATSSAVRCGCVTLMVRAVADSISFWKANTHSRVDQRTRQVVLHRHHCRHHLARHLAGLPPPLLLQAQVPHRLKA